MEQDSTQPPINPQPQVFVNNASMPESSNIAPQTTLPPQQPSKKILFVGIIAIILIIGIFIYLIFSQIPKTSSPTLTKIPTNNQINQPTVIQKSPSPTPTTSMSNEQLDLNLQNVDVNLNDLDNDLNGVDLGLNDKAGDLTE